MVQSNHKSNSVAADAIVIVMILLAGIKFTYGLENTVDVGLYDESNYLYGGIHLASGGLPMAQNAPMYSVWYYFLSLFQPDRVRLYYLNYRLMTFLPPILVYILLRRSSVPPLLSLALSMFMLVSHANVDTWPKVSHFALAICLATLLIVGRAKSLLWASALVSLGALLISYVRPEYFLTYLLSLLVMAFALVKEHRSLTWRRRAGLIAYALVSIPIIGILGVPIFGDRSFLAFGQHFSRNWVNWTGSTLSPWTDWQQIVSRSFGTAQSVPQAFLNNPHVFARHIGSNIWLLIRRPLSLVLPTFLSSDRASKATAAIFIIFLSIVYSANIRRSSSEFRRLLIWIAIFLLPGLVSVIAIYPRDHYLFPICVLVGVLGAVLLGSDLVEPFEKNSKRVLLLGLLLITLTPYAYGRVLESKPNLTTIRFIQSLGIKSPVNMLEAAGGYNIYLDDNYHRVAEYDKRVGFNQFLSDMGINMVVVNSSLSGDSRFKDDPEWQAFEDDSSRFGYVQVDIPNISSKVIVRRDLLTRR